MQPAVVHKWWRLLFVLKGLWNSKTAFLHISDDELRVNIAVTLELFIVIANQELFQSQPA